MATGSFAVLAGTTGFYLYKHLKYQKKHTLIRPQDR